MARNRQGSGRKYAGPADSAGRPANVLAPEKGRKPKDSLISWLLAHLNAPDRDALACPPPGRSRLAVSVFIGAFLLWQVILPLTYYLGDYKNDERYSWRMFSYLGRFQKQCAITVSEKVFARPPEDLPPDGLRLEVVAGNWVRLFKRGRTAVLEKFLHERCDKNPWTIDVRLVRMCPAADGTEFPAGEVVFHCKKGTMIKDRW